MQRQACNEWGVNTSNPEAHVCFLYETEDQLRAVLATFIREGLGKNEKVLCIADGTSSEIPLEGFWSESPDLGASLKTGQLTILKSEDAYLRSGVFDPDDMIALLKGFTEGALAHGLERTYRRKNGTTFPVLFEDRLLTDAEGRIKGIRTTIQDITDQKQQEKERERLIQQLQKALSEVRKLSGMLPICASCKKIRNDKGYWQQVESYITQHSEAQFSHGICPECARKLYPEYYDAMFPGGGETGNGEK